MNKVSESLPKSSFCCFFSLLPVHVLLPRAIVEGHIIESECLKSGNHVGSSHSWVAGSNHLSLGVNTMRLEDLSQFFLGLDGISLFVEEILPEKIHCMIDLARLVSCLDSHIKDLGIWLFFWDALLKLSDLLIGNQQAWINLVIVVFRVHFNFGDLSPFSDPLSHTTIEYWHILMSKCSEHEVGSRCEVSLPWLGIV